jgi:hypothetical protein
MVTIATGERGEGEKEKISKVDINEEEEEEEKDDKEEEEENFKPLSV